MDIGQMKAIIKSKVVETKEKKVMNQCTVFLLLSGKDPVQLGVGLSSDLETAEDQAKSKSAEMLDDILGQAEHRV